MSNPTPTDPKSGMQPGTNSGRNLPAVRTDQPGEFSIEQLNFEAEIRALVPSAGTIKLTSEELEVLRAPVRSEIVEIRPDGIVYLPWMEYASVLNKIFGMEWVMIPNGQPKREGNLILWGFFLIIRGSLCAYSIGEQEYKPANFMMTYGDAIEGAKSNALMRNCKAIGIGLELWRPRFCRDWKKEHAESYPDPKGKRDKNGEIKRLWRRKPDEGSESGLAARLRKELEKTNGVVGPGASPLIDGDDDSEMNEPSESASDREVPGGDAKTMSDRYRIDCFKILPETGLSDEEFRHFCSVSFNLYSKNEEGELIATEEFVASRSEMIESQWKDCLEKLRQFKSIQEAILHLSNKGIPESGLRLYLCCRYMVPYLIPNDSLRKLLASAIESSKTLVKLKAVITEYVEWMDFLDNGAEDIRELFAEMASLTRGMKRNERITFYSDFLERFDVKKSKDGIPLFQKLSPVEFAQSRIHLSGAAKLAGLEYPVPGEEKKSEVEVEAEESDSEKTELETSNEELEKLHEEKEAAANAELEIETEAAQNAEDEKAKSETEAETEAEALAQAELDARVEVLDAESKLAAESDLNPNNMTQDEPAVDDLEFF